MGTTKYLKASHQIGPCVYPWSKLVIKEQSRTNEVPCFFETTIPPPTHTQLAINSGFETTELFKTAYIVQIPVNKALDSDVPGPVAWTGV